MFARHRRELARLASPELETITPEKLKFIRDLYYQHLLDEDEETRLHGFYRGVMKDLPSPTFEEYKTDNKDLSDIVRDDYAQGDAGVFFGGEAEEVLGWDGVSQGFCEHLCFR